MQEKDGRGGGRERAQDYYSSLTLRGAVSCELWVGCRTGRGQLHNQLSSGSSGPVRPDSGRRSSGIPACSPTSSAVLASWSHPML